MVKKWDTDGLQEVIYNLYVVENKPLSVVMRIVQGKFDFRAS